MTGLNSILPKPRSVSRSAKQRFLERDAHRQAEAARFFENRAAEKEAALAEACVARTIDKATDAVPTGADEVLEQAVTAQARVVKPAVSTPSERGLTAEALLSEL